MRLLHVDDATLGGTGKRFLDHMTSRGFELTDPAPLTAADSSVTFVNANIMPFKARLTAGEPVGATCQFQPCVRAHGERPYLFSFGMLGAVTDGEHLDLLADAAPQALLDAMPWITGASLTFAIDRRDDHLAAAVAPFVTRTGAEVLRFPDDELPSRWTYGTGDVLAGRGLTIIYRNGDACGPDCRPRCACGRWVELGNIITIDGPGRGYLEAGFGLEVMQSTAVGGDAYQLPWIASGVARATAAGLPPDDAADAVNLERALDRLLADGARPAGRGPGHIVRKFAARLLGLATRAGDGDLAAGVAALCGTGPVADLLLAEAGRRAGSGSARIAAARAYARRAQPGTDLPAELARTYGLNGEEIAAIVG
jgi:hypothetical protein